ncbi:LysR family transcriptional regulator [Mameliella alba]|nr:LysR family transcriptional regulator [Mameliella alba]MBY6170688.1 LysR family transcriptional regulator [Mameliella alba]MBY6175706.1 LysR family transcriptional regulator [Mameliella alba]
MRNIALLRPSVIFVAVVREGSFNAAAKALGISAPVVSQSVSDLEAKLGAQLLYRTTRKLTLTESGQRYFRQIAGMVEGFDSAVAEVSARSKDLRGRLRLSGPTVLASHHFAAFVQAYRAAFPGVALEIDLTDEHRDLIDERYDLVLRISGLDEPAKGARLLFETRGVVCAAPSVAPMKDPAALEGMCWIRTPIMSGPLTLWPRGGGDGVTLAPTEQVPVNSGQLVRALVDKGMGFAVYPAFAVREALAEGRLIDLVPDWHAGKRGLFGILAARNAELSIANGFLEGLAAHLDARRPKGVTG